MPTVVIDNTIHTSDLSGEALNSHDNSNAGYGTNIETFKQTWEVTLDIKHFKWKVKSELYVKYITPFLGGKSFQDIYIDIIDDTTHTKYLWNGSSNNALVLHGTDGIKVNDVVIADVNQMKNNFTKIMEYTVDIDCLSPNPKTIYIYSGYAPQDHSFKKGWEESSAGEVEYTVTNTIAPIYLTLPRFSGFKLKRSGSWKHCLVWKKINGVWKRSIPYKKINGSWERGV